MPEWVLFLTGQALTAAAVYAGIKADIAKAVVLAEGAKGSADDAHRRIDSILDRRG